MEVDIALHHIVVDGELVAGFLLLVDRVDQQELPVLHVEGVLGVLEQLDLILGERLENLTGRPENEELLIADEDELSHSIET